jgi:transglutaminase-like putative cysteine protease
MKFKRRLTYSLVLAMNMCSTYSQSLFSPRAVALGGNGASVRDTRGFESNPAALVAMRDWEFTTATYSATNKDAGFVFQGITFGKRLAENDAVALKFSPGSLLEFVTQSQFVSGGTKFTDQKLSYSENLSLGYAHRFSEVVAMGANIRLRQQKLSDRTIDLTTFLDTDTTYSHDNVFVDASLMWKVSEHATLAALGKNVVNIESKKFPSRFTALALPSTRVVELSTMYQFSPQVTAYASTSSKLYGAAGFEFLFPDIHFAIRGSVYHDKEHSPFFNAVSVGLGWRYEFLEVDASYLRFTNQSLRKGSGTVETFDASAIRSVDLNPYSPDRVAISIKAIFGNIRESLARIEGVEITSGVYPSSYELFAFRPIGTVRVRNISDKPINAKASFFIERYMNAPTETPAVYMLPGEEKEIPFNAVLNEQVKTVKTLTIREGNVYVNATPAEEYDDKTQTKILIHGRNDWDGDVHSLRHFVTPNDPDVLRYTRDVLLQFRDSLAAVPRELEQIAKARLLFNAFAGKLVYVGDPKQTSDYVQYPSETLTLRSGDCDDMTAFFASLLSSVGVSTAFVDVAPPDSPEESHIYLMFDSGVEARLSGRVSENEKRYVIRKNAQGVETVWIPIETTVITKGFDEAWSVGAEEFLNDAEINLGLVKGWVKIVDVN